MNAEKDRRVGWSGSLASIGNTNAGRSEGGRSTSQSGSGILPLIETGRAAAGCRGHIFLRVSSEIQYPQPGRALYSRSFAVSILRSGRRRNRAYLSSNTMHRTVLLRLPLLLFALCTLAGCATGLRPLTSHPPAAKLTLPVTFTESWWSGVLPPVKFTLALPAGDYLPRYEDDQYFYYEAPAKVVYRGAIDFGSSLYDGGIYVPRNSTAPHGWFFVNEDGSQTFGEFKTPPHVRVSR
jgi:hypothetical protein